MAPATDSVMGAVPEAKAGVASAMNDVARQVSGALGVAVVGSLVASLYSARMEDSTAGAASRERRHRRRLDRRRRRRRGAAAARRGGRSASRLRRRRSATPSASACSRQPRCRSSAPPWSHGSSPRATGLRQRRFRSSPLCSELPSEQGFPSLDSTLRPAPSWCRPHGPRRVRTTASGGFGRQIRVRDQGARPMSARPRRDKLGESTARSRSASDFAPPSRRSHELIAIHNRRSPRSDRLERAREP